MENELLEFSSDSSSELQLNKSSCCFIPSRTGFETNELISSISDFKINEDNYLMSKYECEGLSNLSHVFCPPTQTVSEEQSFACNPDPDSIKMFVGQIPQSFNESDLLQMFEKYGRVFDLRVLRDKKTGRGKGCCFVTYFTRQAAINAQNELHNRKVLPGMHHPVQMKPADSENRNDRKIFIGMLPKSYSETDVRSLFSPFGTIEECTVLRDILKGSKGCAFVTYITRHSAQNAVKSMHHCYIFEGCSSPIVVKFADNQRDKEMRRLHLIDDLKGQFTMLCQQLVSNSILQQQMPMPLNNYTANELCGVQQNVNTFLLNQLAASNPSLFSLNMNQYSDKLNWNSLFNPTLPQMADTENVFQAPLNGTIFDQMPNLKIPWHSFSVNERQIEGPDGANLFIYHLPKEFTDQKLVELFNPYGKVLSAKVFIDKVTKLSKCFGFVSFENIHSARAAITNLNGYQILGKKLKVEVKKKKQNVKFSHFVNNDN